MESSTRKSSEIICGGGFCIEIAADELFVSRDRSAWKPRYLAVAAILVGIFVFVPLVSNRPPVVIPAVSFPILLAILLFVLWPLGVNNVRCTREHLEVIRLQRSNETGRWLFPRALVERIHIEEAWGRPGMGFAIVFTVQGKTVRALRGIELNEAQIVLLELRELGFDVGLSTSQSREDVQVDRGEVTR